MPTGQPAAQQRVRAGTKVTFSCVIASERQLHKPPLSVVWHKDDHRIDYVNNHRFRKLEDTKALVITNVSVKDAGLYRCLADLVNHSAKASAQLVVEGRCRRRRRDCHRRKIIARHNAIITGPSDVGRQQRILIVYCQHNLNCKKELTTNWSSLIDFEECDIH